MRGAIRCWQRDQKLTDRGDRVHATRVRFIGSLMERACIAIAQSHCRGSRKIALVFLTLQVRGGDYDRTIRSILNNCCAAPMSEILTYGGFKDPVERIQKFPNVGAAASGASETAFSGASETAAPGANARNVLAASGFARRIVVKNNTAVEIFVSKPGQARANAKLLIESCAAREVVVAKKARAAPRRLSCGFNALFRPCCRCRRSGA